MVGSCVDPHTADAQLCDIGVLLLSIGDRTLQDRLEVPGTTTLGELQRRQRLCHGNAANRIRDKASLAGGDSSEAM